MSGLARRVLRNRWREGRSNTTRERMKDGTVQIVRTQVPWHAFAKRVGIKKGRNRWRGERGGRVPARESVSPIDTMMTAAMMPALIVPGSKRRPAERGRRRSVP